MVALILTALGLSFTVSLFINIVFDGDGFLFTVISLITFLTIFFIGVLMDSSDENVADTESDVVVKVSVPQDDKNKEPEAKNKEPEITKTKDVKVAPTYSTKNQNCSVYGKVAFECINKVNIGGEEYTVLTSCDRDPYNGILECTTK